MQNLYEIEGADPWDGGIDFGDRQIWMMRGAEEIMKTRTDTYCGLYCGACEVYLANQDGTIEEKAKEWGMDPGDLQCHGCKSDVVSVYCRRCKIKSCAEAKHVGYCFECDAFPCSSLIEFSNDEHSHHSIALHNLGVMRKSGVEAWVAEQKTRWSCPQCGERFSWYDERCGQCGSALRNCRDDEREIREKAR